MNPSTAQILEVVESVPGRRGRHPPQQQEHRRRRRTGVRALGQARVRRRHPRDPGGLRRPARVRPRRRRARRTPAAMAGRRRPGARRGGDPGGPGERVAVGPRSRPGTGSGCRAAGSSRSPRTLSEATCGLLAKLLGDGDEIVTLIEGAGRDRRRHPQGDRVAARAPAGRLPRAAPRGPAALPVPRLGRVSEAAGRPHVAVPRGRRASRELRSVKARKAAGLEAMGIETVLDLLMHYPRRYVDRRHQSEIAALVEDEEAMVTATVRRVSARRTRGGKTMVQVVVEDGTGRLDDRVLQPAVAGEAAAGRLGGRRLRADGDLPGRPPDDEPGRGPRRRPDRPPRARLPTVGQGQDRLDRDRRLRRRGARAHRAAGRGPAAGTGSTTLALAGRTEAFRAIHAPETFEEREDAPAAAWPSTSCSGSSSSSS